MPLVLASSEQMQRCPKTLGSVSPNISMGEMFTKVQSLETVLATWKRAGNRWPN